MSQCYNRQYEAHFSKIKVSNFDGIVIAPAQEDRGVSCPQLIDLRALRSGEHCVTARPLSSASSSDLSSPVRCRQEFDRVELAPRTGRPLSAVTTAVLWPSCLNDQAALFRYGPRSCLVDDVSFCNLAQVWPGWPRTLPSAVRKREGHTSLLVCTTLSAQPPD